MIKKLPVTPVVVAALYSISVLAQEFTQEQIGAITIEVVDKALAECQAKMDAAVAKETDVINEPQSAAQSPDMVIPFGVKFSGYARYGARFQNDDQRHVGVDGSYNGASTIGRLGNEDNGGEFQLSKAFKSNNGAIWDINVMTDHWGNEVNLKKVYVGVTNVLESNPNAYIWAGRDFRQCPQQGINNCFWMDHDGQGTRVRSSDISGVQFSVVTVVAAEPCGPEAMEDEANPSCITCTGGSGTGDRGNYTVTSKAHNMKVGPLDLKIYANYGFDPRAVESDDRLKAWQGTFVLSHTNDSGVNKVIVRHPDSPDNSVYNRTDDLAMVCASFEGNHKFTRQAQVEYLLVFHDYDNNTDRSDNHENYGAVVRPVYFWNDVHSTRLEAGYQCVDYDSGRDNYGWKLTLSQNIPIAMGPESRPMLRFYVTSGKVDNDRTARVSGTQDEALDDFNLDAMWEAQF